MDYAGVTIENYNEDGIMDEYIRKLAQPFFCKCNSSEQQRTEDGSRYGRGILERQKITGATRQHVDRINHGASSRPNQQE